MYALNPLLFFSRTGEKCCLSFKPCGLFGKELHKVEGYILDKRLMLVYLNFPNTLYQPYVKPYVTDLFKDNPTHFQQKESMCSVWEVDGVHVHSGSGNVRGSQEER